MIAENKHIIIGTSGHIDHGKSSLVKALTGTDPDRFKEEKDRGMTIDLGYAFYNDRIAFIDVPGHEKFIKNMVAGVTTIDLVMLVIAADDGVMPQTKEHLDILKVLGISNGFIVLNKIDLAESDWLDLVEEEIRDLVKDTFLQDSPIVRVSAATLDGLEDLRKEIEIKAQESTSRKDRGFFWMPIDRSFSVQGFGTVVTGSVLSGSLKTGAEVDLLPSARVLKVRGLHRHEIKSELVKIGDRAAVNLQGIHRDLIKRGDILVSPGFGLVTKRIDVQLQLLPSSPWKIKDQDRLRFHVATSELFARVRLLDKKELIPGEDSFVQLILESPIAVNRYDRFVVRKYSPPLTIGGGIILDNSPLERHRRFADKVIQHFTNLLENNPEVNISEYLQNSMKPKTPGEISLATGLPEDQVLLCLALLQEKSEIHCFLSGPKKIYISRAEWEKLSLKTKKIVENFHKINPHLSGMSRAEIGSQLSQKIESVILESLIENLISGNIFALDGDLIFLSGFSSELAPAQDQFYNKFLQHLISLQYSSPTLKEIYQEYSAEKKLLDLLIPHSKSRRDIVVLSNGLVYHNSIIEKMKDKISDFIVEKGSISVADFRDIIQASRKYAVAVLEYFDEIGFTSREGDVRVLKK